MIGGCGGVGGGGVGWGGGVQVVASFPNSTGLEIAQPLGASRAGHSLDGQAREFEPTSHAISSRRRMRSRTVTEE